LFIIFGFTSVAVRAETPEEIAQLIEERERQIANLEQQINNHWKAVDSKKSEAATVQNDIAALNEKIQASELEIRSLNLTLQKLGYELRQTENKLQKTEGKIGDLKGKVALALRMLQEREETPLINRLIEAEKLSDIFNVLNEFSQFHGSLQDILNALRETRSALENDRGEILENKESQERLKRIEESQREIVAQRRKRQSGFLTKIEKEKNKIMAVIVTKKRDLDKIREQITYLARAGVSAEEAVRLGELAAIRSGIRASFLIAVLEVESRLGQNVGRGNWRKDMHSRDHDAFLAITKKLGLDPDTTPVSKAPSYGWGGAMGAAQFLPQTWLAYESEVASLTGHNPPSPWNLEDAFTAAAIKLSRQGAAEKTRAGELRAARAYIGGSPNCSRSICNYYANLVLDKAADIEEELRNGS